VGHSFLNPNPTLFGKMAFPRQNSKERSIIAHSGCMMPERNTEQKTKNEQRTKNKERRTKHQRTFEIMRHVGIEPNHRVISVSTPDAFSHDQSKFIMCTEFAAAAIKTKSTTINNTGSAVLVQYEPSCTNTNTHMTHDT